jgi:hypothetical protein
MLEDAFRVMLSDHMASGGSEDDSRMLVFQMALAQDLSSHSKTV